MREIVETLERYVRDVQYGSVSVELRIHEGKVVKTIYRNTKTHVARNEEKHTEVPDGGNS